MASKISSGKIVVSDNGVELAYTDSGAPSDSYKTIFAVHGMSFRAGIYEKMQALAPSSNVRIVAITRRNYTGSTPYSADELRIVSGGGAEDEKTAFVTNYGVELLNFVDKFIQEKNVPTKDGIALVGWSLGTTVVLSAAANMKAVNPDVRARVEPLIKTIIFHDGSSNMYGIPPDPSNWAPWHMVDNTITPQNELPFFAWWISSYFQHGDLSLRSRDVLAFQVPGLNLRPPTAYSIAAATTGPNVKEGTVEVMDYTDSGKVDMTYQVFFFPQLGEIYQRLYDKEYRQEAIANARVYHLGAEHAPAFSPITTWLVQEEDKKHGGGFIEAKIIPGQNHFGIWDDPEDVLKNYLDCIARTL